MAAKHTGLKVLMFPWLAHGHIFPFLELAKKLSKENFSIYFCSTAINLDSIRKNLNLDSSDKDDVSIELVELRLTHPPELPPHYHTTKNIPPHLMPTLMKAFQMSTSIFSDIISDLKPDLLIYDVLQPWSAKIASSQGIPAVHFATTGATTFSYFHHWHTHQTYDTFPSKAIKLKEYEIRDNNARGKSIKVADTGEGFAYGVFQLSCDIVLIKSCRAIEGKYIDHLSTLSKRKMVPTGPLITYVDDQEASDSEIIKWLSERGQRSTLYISFGSENYLSKEQMVEIAKGLELSRVSFIWVARSPLGSDDFTEEALPEGFLERVKERGMFVQTWAPQAAILAHPSVGGFMTHCGWSSITECIYFGVPVLALPLKLDQPVNARLAVEAGVGVEVTPTAETLDEPDWAMNLELCDMINQDKINSVELIRGIKKRIMLKSARIQYLSLVLLETVVKNCEKAFSEVAAERVLDEMVKLIDDPQTVVNNRNKALILIESWGESSNELRYLPVYEETYKSLKSRGVRFPGRDEESLAPIFTPARSVEATELNTTLSQQLHYDIPAQSFTDEQIKEAFDVARNSIELLSTVLSSSPQQDALQDDLTSTLLQQCRQSRTTIQRIIETAEDNEAVLFEALNVNDEIQKVISKYEEMREPTVVPQEPEPAVIPVAVEPDDSPRSGKEETLIRKPAGARSGGNNDEMMDDLDEMIFGTKGGGGGSSESGQDSKKQRPPKDDLISF